MVENYDLPLAGKPGLLSCDYLYDVKEPGCLASGKDSTDEDHIQGCFGESFHLSGV